jgi:hypothetical protein
MVLDTCRQQGVVIVMAGGYAPNLDDVVDIHARTVEIAALLCPSGRGEK